MKKTWIAVLAVAISLAVVVAPAAAQVPESTTQMKLAKDADFLERVAYNLVMTARVVKSEALNTACHGQRSTYAANVINSPESFARVAVMLLVGGVNVIGTVTVNGETGKATSSVTDAALFSQVSSFWSALSGCDSGS